MACNPPANSPPVKAPAIAPATGSVDICKDVEGFDGIDTKSFCRVFVCLGIFRDRTENNESADLETVEKASPDASNRIKKAEVSR